MNDRHHGPTRPRVTGVRVVLALLGFLAAGAVQAQDGTAAVDEEQLVKRLKEEVMQELRESDFLKKEIDAGIKRFIAAQREAQAAAREESARRASEKARNVRRVSVDRDHIFGKPDARISLIEYSDFECPYCKRFHGTPAEVVKAYAGRVNWVYRHYPLQFHNPGAQKQAEGSECAAELGGNEAFWKFTDAIYARTKSNGKGFPLDRLAPLAQEIGLDPAAFEACLSSGRYADRVKEDLEEGARAGISGTPGSIVLDSETGEAVLISGAVGLARFKNVIDRMLD